MTRPDNDSPDGGWGRRGQERHELLAAIGSPQGEAFTAGLEALPPTEGAVKIRWLFAQSQTRDLARAIEHDLRLGAGKAQALAEEIAAARRRTDRAARPYRRLTAAGG